MNIDLKYPTSWEDVTKDHLLILAGLFLKQRTREDLLFELLCKITGIHLKLKHGLDEETHAAVYFFKKKAKSFSLPVSIIRTACEDLSFMVDSIGLPECPILSINNKLYGISFKQYYFADAYMRRYQETKGPCFFYSMYEALTGRKIKRLSPAEILAIEIWWTGLKDYLKGKYPNVFTEGEEAADQTPAEMLHDILHILNNSRPQDDAAILESEVHAVLNTLENIYLKAKTDAHS